MSVMADRKIEYLKSNDADLGLTAYKDAARKGVLLLPRCTGCSKPHWYPRPICPFCHSDALDWQPASGRGTIYSYSIMRRTPEPFVIAFVTLAEGPSMMTNIVDCDFDAIAIGKAVTLTYRQTMQGEPLPMFTLASPS
jgi:uncharacterized OB-fold protein